MDKKEEHDENFYISEFLSKSKDFLFITLEDIAQITEIPEEYIIKAKNGEDIPYFIKDTLMIFAKNITRYHEVLFKNKKRVTFRIK